MIIVKVPYLSSRAAIKIECYLLVVADSCCWNRGQLAEDFNMSESKVNNQMQRVRKQDGVAQDDQGLEKWGTLNVLGQPGEPICTYYRCHHRFSLHGTRSCRCKHPINKTLGILLKYD